MSVLHKYIKAELHIKISEELDLILNDKICQQTDEAFIVYIEDRHE
jgi:hypothetical protein